MGTFEQSILRIRFLGGNQGDVTTIRLCPLCPCLRVATLCDSIYTVRNITMQRVMFRSLPTCPDLNSGHFIWTTLNWVSCFLAFPRSRLKRQSQCVSSLLIHVHLVALWSQRAAVKSRYTQQRFVLWLRRRHELANPWKWFKCLVMFFEPMSREVLEPTFPLALLFGVSPLQEAVFGVPLQREVMFGVPPLREAVVHRLCERRCWSTFREKHCCTIEKCS